MIQRDDEKIKKTLAANLAYYRKECGLTQDELAEQIYYSGKSVSKWERGDGVPDICVLVLLADIFDVTVNDLIAEKHKRRRRAQPQFERNIITLMSLALVWLIAAVTFFFLKITAPNLERAWLVFIIAIPVMFIVAIVLTALWHSPILHFASISGLVWSLALTLHLLFRIENMFLIYVIAAVLQIIIVLWYLLVNTKLLSGLSAAWRLSPNKQKSKPAEPSANNDAEQS
ncbi:MAG: helix-turn-helix domain-containing protein [Clostridia bacterium]|nr:helix-turn-helix domain-containing protein [Clostridia bacterium]